MRRPVTSRESNETQGRSGAENLYAFTLIELLVVISIIGVLAALLVPLSGIATTKMRISRVKAELNQYVTAIESYKLETGSYPPDNGNLRRETVNPVTYRNTAAMNPLFYELTGAVFAEGKFKTIVDDQTITPTTLTKYFNVNGIQNSSRRKQDIDYKGFSIKPSQYAQLVDNGSEEVGLLNVPVPGPLQFTGAKNKKINPWFYDSSTTNRHNKATFDLWAEIITGKNQTNIIANWKN